MAKPINGIPPFTGKAAEWLSEYLETAKPDPKKEEQSREDTEIVSRFVPLASLREKPSTSKSQ
jgi:hypothetical protein